MKKPPLAVVLSALLASSACAAAPDAHGFVIVTDHVAADGRTDAADALQRVIDTHPNRTLYFPDGVYLLSKPIATPAAPAKSVDLRLSNYAVLRAAPGWSSPEAMVRLGGIHPANDIRTPGSCYSFTGGILDGAGVADGLSIDSGRETKVRDVSMKNVRLGLHIKRGANSNSSDCDISDVNIVGNGAADSVGVFVEACDNTLANMRIAHVRTGVKLTGAGNLMRNLHPLMVLSTPALRDGYNASVGFEDLGNNNRYDCCYSDHFATGFLFRKGNFAFLSNCIVFWYGDGKNGKGQTRTALRCQGRFGAHVTDLYVGFKGTDARNALLETAEDGGNGFLMNPVFDEKLVNDPAQTHLKYLKRFSR